MFSHIVGSLVMFGTLSDVYGVSHFHTRTKCCLRSWGLSLSLLTCWRRWIIIKEKQVKHQQIHILGWNVNQTQTGHKSRRNVRNNMHTKYCTKLYLSGCNVRKYSKVRIHFRNHCAEKPLQWITLFGKLGKWCIHRHQCISNGYRINAFRGPKSTQCP